MYVVCVTIFVKPEFVRLFIDSTFDNATNTLKEPGNLRFDVLQADDDPHRFFLYEVYKTKENFVEHQQTEHYARWKNTVAEWMAQPRTAVKHIPLFYGESKI